MEDTAAASPVSGKWQAARLPPGLASSGGSRTSHSPATKRRAARVEATAGGRVGRRRQVAGEDLARGAPWRSCGSATGHRRQQRGGVGVARVREELVGGRELDDLAEVHHRDPVAHVAHDRQVVGDEDHRQPEVALQVAQEVEDLRLDRDVERRHRLVGDDDPRAERERARDADALALAAGELVRVAVVVLGVQPDAAPCSSCTRRVRSARPARCRGSRTARR